MVYSDVFPNVDIEYVLASINLKENIVLKDNSAQNEFVAAYDIGSLSVEQIDEKNIELRDAEGNVVFCICAPYMYDAKDEISGAVVLSILSNSDGMLTVKIIADKKWLQDESRAYPVKIDPDVLKAVQSFDQDATAIHKTISSSDYPFGTLVIGNDRETNYNKAKSYVKFSLPTLKSGDVVIGGMFYIYQYGGEREYTHVGNPTLQINVYQVLNSWTASSVINSHGYNGLPSSSSKILDYAIVGSNTTRQWVSFDVSKAVKSWYEESSTNYGLCLMADDENAWAVAQFVASDNDYVLDGRPQLQVTYRSNKGLEGYWSNHEQNLGESGTGYVSDYTGNLVYIAPLLSTTGNMMPVSLSLIYNGYQHGSNIDRPNTVGKGWRLNIQQKVTPISNSGGLNSDLYDRGYRYIYSDSDGTDHYFMVDPNDSSKIIDEDGLGLTLSVTTGSDLEKYVIKSDSGGKMTFSSRGYLKKVYDDNGNYYNVIYSTDPDKVGQIIRVEDGVGRRVVFNRNANGRINEIEQQMSSDSSQTRTISFNYTDWDGLRSITYPGSRTTTFYYTESGKKLNTVDAINGNRITYSYPSSGDTATKSRVVGITEYSSGSTRLEGNSLSISYAGMNRTKFTDNHTPTNRSETYQFDNCGRTVGIIDAAGNGSQYNYSSTSGKTANALKSTGVATKFVDNRFKDHSFESGLSAWGTSDSGVYTAVSQYYYGEKSVKLLSNGYISQKVSKDENYQYYTASIYAYGSSDNSKLSFKIYFYDANGNSISSVSSVQDLSEGAWERKQFTFNTSSVTGAASFRVYYKNTGSDAIFIDCAQLENGATMNAYNIVQNGGFENTAITAWDVVNCSSSDGYYANGYYGRCFHMIGSGSADKRLIQKIYINKPANKVFLSVSGYAYANSVPVDNGDNRRFALSVSFHCTDGSETYEYIPFNDDYTGGWQYASGTVGVKSPAGKTVDYVYIRCCYYENANSVYFDRIQVNIDECGTSYTYDDDGNLISAKDNAGRHETYNYNNANDMTKLTATDNKAYDFTYSEVYKHRMLSATSESSGVKYNYGYDDFGNSEQGNVTSVKVSSTDSDYSKYIKQFTEYTPNGNYVSRSTNDRGYETLYSNGAYTGNLLSVRELKTNETSNSPATYYSTYYTYESGTDRIKYVSDQENHPARSSTVGYTYNSHGYLTKITTPSTNYEFTYDYFGNNLTTTAGGNLLVTNDYANNNGMLTSQTYGNNDSVSYTYDSLDRETSRKYNNSTKYKWSYNADGTVGSHTDNYINKKYAYTYDNIGRLLRVDCSDGSYVKTNYNNLDQSTSLSYGIDASGIRTYFGYSSQDNLPLYVEFGTNRANKISNSYDKLTRLSNKTYATTDTNTPVQVEYTYKDLDTIANRTTGLVKGIKYTVPSTGLNLTDKYYSYDCAGNITSERKWIGDSNNPLLEKYTYDSKKQLIRHDSVTQGKTFTYAYDAAGNITEKSAYPYTLDEINTADATQTISYSYINNDSTWYDLLTEYDGQNIIYDDIGNPITYLGWTMTWQGRRLATASNDNTNTSLSFTYNADGIRTSKTVGTTKTEYLLNGTQILAQKTGDNVMWFIYDSTGARVGLIYNGYIYYYIYNLQGDVIGIARASTGKIVATYSYDAWGKCSVTKLSGYSIGDQNPFRYRGYYYDSETGLYYLNSRYYNPEVGRFINADAFATTNIGGVLSANMFSYCENNPINAVDYLGHNPLAIFAGVGAAIASALSAAVTAMVALTVAAVAVHTVDQVAEKIKEKVKTKQDTSPRDQSVYILKNQGGDVRYVGRTNNPPRRMAEHERDVNHPERKNYKMTVVFSGLTDKQAVLTEQILISTYTLEHLDNARREISAGRIAAFKAEVSSVAELLGGFAEDEIMNLGRRR